MSILIYDNAKTISFMFLFMFYSTKKKGIEHI
jgi:hypothetical protein